MERQLVEAEDEVRRAPNPALLDYLPVSAVELAEMPDELSRRPFEALRLEIRYDHNATCCVTLLGDTVDLLATVEPAGAGPDGLGGLDRRGIQDRRAGLGVTPGTHP